MQLRILGEYFVRRKRRVAVAVLAVAVGASLVAVLFTLATGVSERMSRELRAYGANILVTPGGSEQSLSEELSAGSAARLLDETELYKLKTIFWRNNILGFAPYLSVMARTSEGQAVAVTGTWYEKRVVLPESARPGSSPAGSSSPQLPKDFVTGTRSLAPWWRVEGEWVKDDDVRGALVGSRLAKRLGVSPGGTLDITAGGKELSLEVRGLLRTGGLEEDQVFVTLPAVQRLAGKGGGASQILVSALVTPKDKIPASIRGKSPEEMTPAEYEIWYCTPLIESIAFQIQEALPGASAVAVRQISEAESNFVDKMESLLALVAIVALGTSALGVMTTMTAGVLERRKEIGLMKALGADNLQLARLFFSEAAVIGVLGGGVGYAAGLGLGRLLGQTVFGAPLEPNVTSAVLSLAVAVAVALLGSIVPVRAALRLQPTLLLKGS